MFEFHGEDITEEEDGGIIRRIDTKGKGYTKPNEGASVEGKHTHKQSGTVGVGHGPPAIYLEKPRTPSHPNGKHLGEWKSKAVL